MRKNAHELVCRVEKTLERTAMLGGRQLANASIQLDEAATSLGALNPAALYRIKLHLARIRLTTSSVEKLIDRILAASSGASTANSSQGPTGCDGRNVS